VRVFERDREESAREEEGAEERRAGVDDEIARR
jgi:hypothetical protein